ncbi:MAG TPA: hypothetical protein DEP35_24075, partial [Deltaproteobacteria bacterium]|nr:hypothetical protein [Deltaproteobacteria bacterium]
MGTDVALLLPVPSPYLPRFRKAPDRTLWAGIASGVLLGLALVPRSTGLLAFVALVPLISALDSAPSVRWALRSGFACGLVFFLLSCAWVPFAGAQKLGLLLTYLLATPLLALPAVGFALASAWLRRFGRTTFLVAAPALWVVTELARCSSELGSQFHLGYAL